MFRRLHEEGPLTVGVWECPHREPGWCSGEQLVRAEVVVPLSGAYVRESPTGVHFASPATTVLGSPGEEVRVRHPVGGGDRCAVFLLDDEALDDLGRATGALDSDGRRFRESSLLLSAPLLLRVHRLLDRLASTELDAADAGFRIAELLEALVEPAGRGADDAGTRELSGSRRRRAVLDALEFMAASFTAPLTLADVARAAGYSPFHFARLFKAVTGSTVHGRLTELRLRSALDQIRQGADDLTTVALRAGFSSHSHFTAAFRKRFGVPPSRARGVGPTGA